MEKKTIWFDFDNSPHPVVLLPAVKELRRKGFDIFFTVRDVAQTVGIMKNSRENFIVVGKEFSKSRIIKLINTLYRALRLIFIVADKTNEITCCVSCSSRSAILAGWLLRKPVVAIYDYEFVNSFFQNMFADIVLMPELITVKTALRTGLSLRNLIHYEGLKEYFYLNDYKPVKDPFEKFFDFRDKIRVVLRPPAFKAHYRLHKNPSLYNKVINFLKAKDNIFLFILPRYQSQIKELKEYFKDARCSYAISERALYGPDVVFYADYIFGDGGTMLREAAALGTPAYSFFSGPEGVVDKFLRQRGRLRLIKSSKDVEEIEIIPRIERRLNLLAQDDTGLKKIVECIERLAISGKIDNA